MNNREIKVSIKDIPEVIEKLEWAEKKINDLQSKIDKAIEYMEENFDKTGICVSGSDLPYSYIEDLLKMLKGEDK